MSDTIVAPATPPGRGGVGVIRISGSNVLDITKAVCQKTLKPRYATFCHFLDESACSIDHGLAIYFPAPNSFTGEDVLELQGHGGPVVMDLLLKRVIGLGARMARPGEFSERSFLNNKLDLAQAEAVADLIDASSELAVRSALRSLQGEFSQKVQQLKDEFIHLRIYVEAAIDFPDEEIDFLKDGKVLAGVDALIKQLNAVLESAKQGRLLREGMKVVIAGKPNAGKSSLLNQLSGEASAIVTDIPGTTRDLLREQISIDGLPLHIIDTAGLRDSDDIVEQEGVRRANEAIKDADKVLLVVDDTVDEEEPIWKDVVIVHNKIDLTGQSAQKIQKNNTTHIYLSAKSGQGIQLLKEHLKACMGYQSGGDGCFIARRRHLDALQRAATCIKSARKQLVEQQAGEIVAEELRLGHQALSEITGEFRADDLLGEIFSSFCIGK